MVDFRPFRGWRPPPQMAAEVAAVPYDVVNTAEARDLVLGHPNSLLRVTRPDVELPDDVSLYSPEAYALAKANLDGLIKRGALLQDPAVGYYVYALRMGDHQQIGVVGLASAADYWADRIKKHEHTRPAKEDDRMRHIEAVRAHLGPVFLTYRKSPDIDHSVATAMDGPAAVDFVAPDGVRHAMWPVLDSNHVSALNLAFGRVAALYIADGHHRAAAASRIGKDAELGDARGHFLAVAFPDDQLQILSYNRVVQDLNGQTPEEFMVHVEKIFDVTRLDGAQAPGRAGCFTMFHAGQWMRLTPRMPLSDDPVQRLDVSVLQDRLLGPVLGIDDPRTNDRIDFVGGIRGLAELEKRAGEKGVAFATHATDLKDLLAVADAGRVMPPKSTWFEPKLRSGLVISRY